MNRLFKTLPTVLTLLMLMDAICFAARQAADPAAIRNELKEIRRTTDWTNAAAAKRANERTQQLIKKLNQLQAERKGPASPPSGQTGKDAEEVEASAASNREKMWDKIQQAGGGGGGAVLDLAEPVRQKVVEEYREDRDHSIKNAAFYQELTLLVIDLSSKEAPELIAQMDKFTSIRTLVLTGGKSGAPVDLAAILHKARKLPLTELYVINFRGFLSSIPESVAQFPGLARLTLFGNNIKKLPASVGKMQSLRSLHVDMNPIDTLLPTVCGLAGLAELGIGKTGIGAAEQGQLANLLPNCRILSQ